MAALVGICLEVQLSDKNQKIHTPVMCWPKKSYDNNM